MENQVDELYCFCYESRDGLQWELWNSLWKGQGMKKVLSVPKEQLTFNEFEKQDMMFLILLYLNDVSNQLSYEDRLKVEVNPPRALPTIIRASWWEQRWCATKVFRFLTQKNGKWVEINEPKDFVPIWGEDRSKKKSYDFTRKGSINLVNEEEILEVPIKEADSKVDNVIDAILDIQSMEEGQDSEGIQQQDQSVPSELLEYNEDPNQISLF